MAKPKGFLLPQNIDPEDNCYVILSVPNDERYLQAVRGSYEELGYWFAWERDPLRQGKVAAERMRQSIAETIELWEEIGCMSPLEINVTCGNQCCVGIQDITLNVNVMVPVAVYNEIYALPGGLVDDGQTAPDPVQWPVYQDYTDYKCKFANEYAANLLQSWENLARLGLAASSLSIVEVYALVSSGALGTAFVGLVGAGIAAPGIGAAILALFYAIGLAFGATVYRFFNDMLAEWDQDEIVCAIYGATDAAEAHNRLLSVMSYWASIAYGQQGWAVNGLVQYVANLVSSIVQNTPLEAAFDVVDYIDALPDSVCTQCSLPSPPPDPDGLLTDLVAFYEFEQIVNDERADAHGDYYLTEVGVSHNLAPGIVNMGESFIHGMDSVLKADHPQHTKLTIPSSTTWSISAWIKPLYTTEEVWAVTTSWNNAWNLGGTVLALLPDFRLQVKFGRNGGGSWRTIDHIEDYVGGAWYHVAWGYIEQQYPQCWLQVNNGTRQVVDLITPPSTLYHFVGTSQPLMIGGSAYIFNDLWQYNGIVDEVAVWIDRNLSLSDVAAIYRNGAPLAYSSWT